MPDTSPTCTLCPPTHGVIFGVLVYAVDKNVLQSPLKATIDGEP